MPRYTNSRDPRQCRGIQIVYKSDRNIGTIESTDKEIGTRQWKVTAHWWHSIREAAVEIVTGAFQECTHHTFSFKKACKRARSKDDDNSNCTRK
jgi:hypothetical protein